VKYLSSASREFLNEMQDWFKHSSEILVLIRFSRAGGSKSFEFFSSLGALRDRLSSLPPQTNAIAFREPQLQLRGIVDDAFIDWGITAIPNGCEFVVVETVRRQQGSYSWFDDTAGESHIELREALERSRGKPVAVGKYPPWTEDSSNVISCVVPDTDGVITPGVY
jgi:hypothetical protein